MRNRQAVGKPKCLKTQSYESDKAVHHTSLAPEARAHGVKVEVQFCLLTVVSSQTGQQYLQSVETLILSNDSIVSPELTEYSAPILRLLLFAVAFILLIPVYYGTGFIHQPATR